MVIASRWFRRLVAACPSEGLLPLLLEALDVEADIDSANGGGHGGRVFYYRLVIQGIIKVYMGISVRRVRRARLPQADPKPTTGPAFADALLPETPLLETLSKINLGERVLTVGFAPSKIGIVKLAFWHGGIRWGEGFSSPRLPCWYNRSTLSSGRPQCTIESPT